MSTVPLALAVAGKTVVAVGGGTVAAAKVEPLLAAGAIVRLVAPTASDALHHAVAEWRRRPYAGSDDLQGAWLAIAATGDPAVDDAVVGDAEQRRIWCVRSGTEHAGDAPRPGSASFMGVVRRDPLLLAVASGAPAVTRHVRERLEETFGREYGALAELIARLRRDPVIREHLATLDDSQRKMVWRSLPLVHILGLLREGAFDAATELASACLSSSSD